MITKERRREIEKAEEYADSYKDRDNWRYGDQGHWTNEDTETKVSHFTLQL